jgi:hypothetical protein
MADRRGDGRDGAGVVGVAEHAVDLVYRLAHRIDAGRLVVVGERHDRVASERPGRLKYPADRVQVVAVVAVDGPLESRDRLEQVDSSHVQGIRELAQCRHRGRVAVVALQLADDGDGDLGTFGETFLGQAAAAAKAREVIADRRHRDHHPR